ncbi:polyprenol phosphomannose-dependent alpha 1,6 mannosyltransferase MptB [Cryptosporangium aurantiacum]|uniref:Alpha-1,6-mannosyltransferase/alpha-1,6-mannosyltransferase n=1 Tax=Cryptosporangium aurantiacum TaxID=134849 RepID=A0A1M7H7Z9_9ACTN|nr:polyprenol phosphomannose-dependent alpha 1,6 mannosyltransferase MptB [Cryptosporangium aurantiacum]SHM24692.1 alpha-1,6-mannosyltransferase/alpha-1,6-mannosyltransferase [Cryptosporangium aurantiacum]
MAAPVEGSGPPALTLVTWGGTAASAAIALGVTRAGTAGGATPPDGPLGLWRPDAEHPVGWAVLALLGLTVLALAFLQLYRIVRARGADVRAVATIAAWWSAPMLVAPPVLSLDVWSYLAQGTMVHHGIDPYTYGPSLLGPGTILDSVSPVWRDTPAPYGPLMLATLWGVAIASAGHLSIAVLLLRALVVLAVVAVSLLVVRLAPADERALGLTLVAANPLVVVHLIGGAHLDALLALLAAVTIWSVRRRWYVLAALAAATAFSIKLPGILLIAYLVAHLVRQRVPLRHTLTAVAATGAVVIGYALLVPDGWGWLGAMDVPGRVRIYWAPASLVGGVLYLVTGAALPFTDALALARSLVGAAGAITVAVLLWRAGAEPSWRRAGALVGAALLTLAISAPVMHAWYVVWGGVLLAACAGPRSRHWAVVLGAALCFSAVPDHLGGTVWSVLAVPVCLLIVVVDAVRTVTPPRLARWVPAGAAVDTA